MNYFHNIIPVETCVPGGMTWPLMVTCDGNTLMINVDGNTLPGWWSAGPDIFTVLKSWMLVLKNTNLQYKYLIIKIKPAASK